jgi:hypothetical protein
MCSAPPRQPAGFQEASSPDDPSSPNPVQKTPWPQACLPARPPRASPNPVPIQSKCKPLETLKICLGLPGFGSNGYPVSANPRKSSVASVLGIWSQSSPIQSQSGGTLQGLSDAIPGGCDAYRGFAVVVMHAGMAAVHFRACIVAC